MEKKYIKKCQPKDKMETDENDPHVRFARLCLKNVQKKSSASL